MFGCLLGWYIIHTFWGGALAPDGILPAAKFTLRPNLGFSYIASVTARHSGSGHQPNFAAFSRGRHLYSAGRPSRWASAHILVRFVVQLVTGSIARSAKRRYISYSETDFEGFRPARATRCTDGVKFSIEDANYFNLAVVARILGKN